LEGGTYYLTDTSKAMFDPARSNPPQAGTTRGAIIVQDARNRPETSNPTTVPTTFLVSSKTANGGWLSDAVSAAFSFSKTYDYYLERHGRNSVDGTGGNILGVVRLGKGFDNAFWASDLGTMFFGDAQPFAGALDVVAHELTHGVTTYTANLVYQGQSGALNEAFSDIFGEMVEAYVEGSNDWLIGSRLAAPVRDMKNPSSLLIAPGLPYPEKMSQYIRTAQDNGGVHLNSGIVNKAYYLLVEGLGEAIGRNDAERIFYRALAFHLTQNAQFSDARLACVQAAEELFGAGSPQVAKVGEAFDSVEIFESPPPGTTPIPGTVGGEDAVLYVYFDSGAGGYRVGRREFAQGDGSAGTVMSAGLVQVARPSVSADGSLAIYVNDSQDACLIDTLYPVLGETCLGRGGIHSVAMAPDGEHFAFVLLDASGEPGSEILEVDIKTGGTRVFKLIAPGTEGVNISSVVQADAMAFTGNGRFLIYDALNVIRQDDGAETGAWSIYAIDLVTGQTLILIPPVLGEDIGNPAVGNLSDDLLAFDAQDQATGNTSVMAARLSTGQVGTIAETTGLAGPVYAGDDSAIVFSVADGTATGRSLYRQALSGDRITPTGAAEAWLANAEYGAVYRRGARFKLQVKLAGKGSGRVVSTPAGIDCGDTCAGLYAKGTKLKLQAIPDYGAKFVRWKGACTGKRACRLKMKKARTVTAVFKALPFRTLTVKKSGSGSGQVTGSPAGIDCGGVCRSTYSADRVIVLTATPGSDSVFRGWRGACSGKGTCRVKMSKNRKVFARFALRSGG
ncbi:MAG: Thermolysin, partial [Proteobacteria bacterium]|nr:Thermolysin [Pseudomonadota bacterium]